MARSSELAKNRIASVKPVAARARDKQYITNSIECLKYLSIGGEIDPKEAAILRKALFSNVCRICPSEAKAYRDKKPPVKKPPAKPEPVKTPRFKLSKLAVFSVVSWAFVIALLYWAFTNMPTLEQVTR